MYIKILLDHIKNKKIILEIEENKYTIPIKFDLRTALALETKCGSLDEIGKVVNLKTSIWALEYMLNAGINRYNTENTVKLPLIEGIEKYIVSDSITDAIVLRSLVLHLIFNDFAPDEETPLTNDKKKESETPEMTSKQ